GFAHRVDSETPGLGGNLSSSCVRRPGDSNRRTAGRPPIVHFARPWRSFQKKRFYPPALLGRSPVGSASRKVPSNDFPLADPGFPAAAKSCALCSRFCKRKNCLRNGSSPNDV